MAEAEKLTISDAESAYKAISDLIIQYPNYPASFDASAKTVRWNMVDLNNIGIFPLSGAIYLKKYINGAYTAQLPFEIVYRCAPTTNKASISAQDFLTDLARWLEKCVINFKDEKITLEAINRTTPVFLANQDDKMTEFVVNLQLKYSSK